MNKNNGYAVFSLTVLLLLSGAISGCSNNEVKPVVSSKVKAAKSEVVVISNGAAAKDKHHVEYDKKRMWYNQQWVSQQQNKQKLKGGVKRQNNAVYTRSASAQPTKLPHYGLPANIQHQAQQPSRARQQNQYASGGIVRQRHSNVHLAENLSQAAIARTYQRVRYDGRYIPISYPMGDVPANIGVCTDTVIRSYRRLGVDLQRLVHEDMSRAFHAYPNLRKWGLSAPDANIDHRRVHNLKVFFSRHGRRLPVTNNPEDYRPGDLVTWDLRNGGQEHIGLVVNRRSPTDPRRHMIVHNIANGDKMEDVLFALPITGHYRYLPGRSQQWIASAR
uniref:DUF1287 domain-containing protein n=1 Tax=uncultured Thiotrichaceae bacterium TaxID=298394 RepID=A0A6S6UDL6_9GAMM|nr:MAG: Unknown protein [uncultured Thiotrichaceae bacterium]